MKKYLIGLGLILLMIIVIVLAIKLSAVNESAEPATSLYVKEWGIEIKLSEQTKDVFYVVGSSTKILNTNVDIIKLYSRDLIPSFNCHNLKERGYVGVIQRTIYNPLTVSENMMTPPAESVKQSSGYYYAYWHPSDVCSDLKLEYSKINEITKVIQTIETVK